MAKENIENMIIKYDINTETFWDIYGVLSYNAFMNIAMGGRGIGKTWQVIIWCLNRFKKTGKQFIYLRRYKSETTTLKNLLSSFVDDITFTGDGNGGGSWNWKGHTIGYLKALSVAQNFKSNNFENVETIIYDEAIIKKSISQRYLKDEIMLLFEFMSTVFRVRTKGRVFVLGNNLDFFNPYCQYFNIKVFNKKYYDKERSIYLEYCDTQPELKKLEEETPLYKLTKNTAYHDYHYDNKVLSNNLVSNSKKRSNDKMIFRMIINNYTINVYIRDNNNWLLECKDKVIRDENTLVIMENSEINWYYFDLFRTRYEKYFLYLYYDKRVEYTDDNAQSLTYMLIDCLI